MPKVKCTSRGWEKIRSTAWRTGETVIRMSQPRGGAEPSEEAPAAGPIGGETAREWKVSFKLTRGRGLESI